MIKLSILLVAAAVATVCSGRYLPKKEFVKQTPAEWDVTAKRMHWNQEQTTAVINLLQFIQENDLGSAEMTDEKEILMLEKCEKLADKIDELNEHVGEKKWADVKDKDLTEKLQFWNEKYETWSCEEGKMKAIKNMCSLITENAKKKQYLERATRAGLKDEQLKAMVDLLWDMKMSKKVGTAKAKLADRCEIIGSDGKMLEISEKHMANFKWSDMADKNISMKMEFWWNVTKESDCNVAKVKALVNLCDEFMCPIERKKIEDVAKEAGLTEEDIPAAIDLEMRMNFAQGDREQSDMLMESFKRLGKNKQMMEIPLTDDETKKWGKLETDLDFVPKVHFWTKKYNGNTGVDHIKSLKNMCSVMVRDWEKYAEHDKKLKEKNATQTN